MKRSNNRQLGTTSIYRSAFVNRFINSALYSELSPLWRYSLAGLALVIAVLLKLGLNVVANSSGGSSTPFLTIFAAIMVAAWYGGFGPGLAVTLFGALAAHFFFLNSAHPFVLPDLSDWINLAVFVLEGILISGLCDVLRQALSSRTQQIDERTQAQEALAQERERYAITLASIGDAVIATDIKGRITFMNSVAQDLTGWNQAEATGHELSQVFKIINEESRQPVENPVVKVLELGTVVGLANHTLLITKAGQFIPIDDSGAPIKDRAGETIGVVLVFRDVTERKRHEEEQQFLVQASEVLVSTLEYEETLQNIVQMAVPFLADWCSIDLVGEDGTIRRIASSHVNPAKQPIVHQLMERFPYPPDQPHPLKDLLLAGRSQLASQFSESDLERISRSPEHFSTLKELGLKSGITVPLVVRGGGVGAFTLGITESERHYTEHDLSLAQELARRASLALDNSRLYMETQRALAERSEAVSFYRKLEEQLTLLVEASDSLLRSLKLSAVLPAILDLSRQLIAADAYGVWRGSDSDGEWRTLASNGLSRQYQQVSARSFGSGPAITAPIIAEDVEAIPALASRLENYRNEGIRSLLVVPLRIQGIETGTIAFYYREPHHFSELEIRGATALANLAAAAIGSTELYEAQTALRLEAETAQRRVAFLAEASNVLASSLNYETTLQTVAELVVPTIADWCSVHVVEQEDRPRQLALAHIDPSKVEWALKLQQEMEQRYPYDPDSPSGLPKVLRTGQAEIYPTITDEMLVAAARDEEQLNLIREMGYSSAMIVPMKARDRVVGALQLVATTSGYHYGTHDLELVQELANRAAMAIDNARLYAEAQKAISIREDFLSVAANELKTPVTSLRGFAQLLLRQLDKEKEPDSRRLRTGLETINQQSERLVRLILRLLDFSKLQGGRLIIEPEMTDFVSLVERVVAGFRTTTEKHTLTTQTPSSLPICIDPLRMEQVVTNLVDNAIKYSPEGGAVELSLTSLPSHLVQLIVTDQGTGILPQYRERIFEPFYQAHERVYAGIGMGLYITRQIVELHGGTIEVEFPGEGGTRFVVILPDGIE